MGSSTSITHTNPSLMVERKHRRHSHHHQQEKQQQNLSQSLNLSSTSSPSPKHSKYVHNSVDDLALSSIKPGQHGQIITSNRQLVHQDGNFHSSPNNLQHVHQGVPLERVTSPTSSKRQPLNSPPSTPSNKKQPYFTPASPISGENNQDQSRRGHIVLPQIQATTSPNTSCTNNPSAVSIPSNSKEVNSPKSPTSITNETFYSKKICETDPFQSPHQGSSLSNSVHQPKNLALEEESFTPVTAFTPLDDYDDDSKVIYMHPYHATLPPLSPTTSTSSKTSSSSASNCSSTSPTSKESPLSSPKNTVNPSSPKENKTCNPVTADLTCPSKNSTACTHSGTVESTTPNIASSTLITISSPINTNESKIRDVEFKNSTSSTNRNDSKSLKSQKPEDLKRTRPISATTNPLSSSLDFGKFKDDTSIGRKSKINTVGIPVSNVLSRSIEEPTLKLSNPVKTKKRSTSVMSNPKKGKAPAISINTDDDMVMMEMPQHTFNRFELQKQFMNTDQKSKEMKIDLRSSVTLDFSHREVLSMFSNKQHQKNILSPINSPTKHVIPSKSQDDTENLGNDEIRITVTPPTFLPDLSHLNMTHLQLRMLSNERSQKRKMARSNKKETACGFGMKFD